MSVQPIRVLLIEDDLRVAQVLQRGLQEQDFVVTVAHDGLTGQKLALQQAYDVVITDVILPKIDGLVLCQLIKQSQPDLPILMLTALGTTDDKVEGFDAGADDYLVKPFEMRELIARIKALVKRSKKVTNTANPILQYDELEMNLHTKMVKRKGIEIHLTPKEFNLLQYFMQNPERVISRTEIAEKVWDTHFDTGTNFVDVYINYLRKKIDKAFDKKLIHTKSGMGFMLKAEHATL